MPDKTIVVEASALRHRVEASRRALLEVLSGSAIQWSDEEVATWLAGMYRDATLHAPGSNLPPDTLAPYWHLVREALAHARKVVTTRMHKAARGEFGFAVDALEAGNVEQVRDRARNYAFLPVDSPGMTLCDRIESLLAADYLTRPADYEERLSFCRCCTAASFSAEARVRGQCSTHTSSGVRVRQLPCPSKHGTLIALGRMMG